MRYERYRVLGWNYRIWIEKWRLDRCSDQGIHPFYRFLEFKIAMFAFGLEILVEQSCSSVGISITTHKGDLLEER